jgi:hypothetical protein
LTEKGIGDGLQAAEPAFGRGGAIPPKYTRDGTDVSPSLRWTDSPEGTSPGRSRSRAWRFGSRNCHELARPSRSISWPEPSRAFLEVLRRDFAAAETQGDIEIFMDRRDSARRQAVRPREVEGRDWNRHRAVRERVRQRSCAFVPQLPPLLQSATA